MALLDALGLPDIEFQQAPTTDAPVMDDGDIANIDNDYRTARANYFKILTEGMAAMSDLATIAKETKQPQTYVAFTNLAKTMSDINANLLTLTERRSRLRKEGDKPSPKVASPPTNYGSTQEMLERFR
jgi:hypothetical protein